MWELFVNVIGINGVEALLAILFCTNFKIRDYEKFDLLLCWTSMTLLNYLTTLFLPFPPLSQILIIVLYVVLMSVILKLNILKSALKMAILLIFICSMSEGIIIKILETIFNTSYLTKDYIVKFFWLLPSRFIEVIIIYLLSGGGVYEILVGKTTEKRKN